MDITPVIDAHANIITSYNREGFTVRDRFYTGAILLSQHSVWKIGILNPSDLNIETIAPALAEIEELEISDRAILLLGTGSEHFHLSKKFLAPIAAKIPVEVMSSPAACRTYNILLAEAREVYALLLI